MKVNGIDKFIGWIEKHPLKAFFIFILVFFFPLTIVHVLFKLDVNVDFASAEWTAGDVLGYVSGFIAFLGTAILGIVSYRQTEKANQMNKETLKLTRDIEKKSVIPYLTFNWYLTRYEGSYLNNIWNGVPLEDDDENAAPTKPKRIDFILDTPVVYIKPETIEIASDLSEEEKEEIQSKLKPKNENGTITLSRINTIYHKIKVENNGKGVAIDLSFKLFKKEKESCNAYLKYFLLPVEKSFDLGICINRDQLDCILGDYIFEFSYESLYGNRYLQRMTLSIQQKNLKFNVEPQQEICQ